VKRRLTGMAAVVAAAVLAGCSGAREPVTMPTPSGGPPGFASASDPQPSTELPPAASSSAAPPSSSLSSTGPQPAAPSSTLEAAVPTRTPALDPELIDAAWANDVELARELIASGADVNAKDDTEQSAYPIATSEGYRELVELTLANGADLSSLDSYRGTGLIRAAELGHAAVVGRLLRAGIAADHVNRPGWTALDEAIVYGDGGPTYQDTVRALVAGGADLQPVAGDGRTPLQHARDAGHDVLARTLESAVLAHPADVAAASALLLSAAGSGDADQIAIALRAGAAIESSDGRERTALLLASAADHLDVARLLVALGADPDAQDDQQDSAWLVTGVTGSVAMLEVLLPAGPDLALRNRFGGVSMIPASERGHIDYVRRVVSTGIDVNHVNDPGWTALLEAITFGDGSQPYQEIVGILLAAGADPALADAQGVTPLEHAQSRGFGTIAAALRQAGG
jgi:ankyrin repeat protein